MLYFYDVQNLFRYKFHDLKFGWLLKSLGIIVKAFLI